MKKTVKRICLIAALVLLLSLLSSCASGGSQGGASPTQGGQAGTEPPSVQNIRMSAGPSGGFNYTLFAGIADVVGKEYPGLYDVQIDISTGTSENARNVMLGEATFGMVGLDVVKDAYDAAGEFEGMEAEQINHVISGPAAIVHIMVPAASKIETLEDLIGKKVGVGKGVMATYLPDIFEAMGVDYTGTEMTQLTITDMCNGLADGTIDAGLYGTPYPTATISDFSMTTGLKLIPVPEDIAEKVIELYPFFYTTTIPADAYNGLKTDTPTIARRSAIMTNPKVPEDTVYHFLKVIVERNDELVQIHADAASLSL